MQVWHILIIILVLAIIIGNVLLIKHSAKMELKKPNDKESASSKKEKSPN
ncbi:MULTISPECIES: DUF2897 family protein [unclassified Pseudoalteromonas]|nr:MULTISPECIES: DUF2897 family protein [unclassified Pseudoalteromonas]MDN3380615.1 DUF2897 family protein [Pseudoalteromonas sp. APC 3893]MDN3389002.1 DUF2897 family protein [Pseudoalteromonas sp. APC 4017]OUS68516.1 hypothetical protein B5G52_19485 [Pseudoalteromonas sp. A601]